MKVLVVFTTVLVAALAAQFSYDGYKVYRLHPTDNYQMQVLTPFTSNPKFDFWSPLRFDQDVDVMVEPQTQKYFEVFLQFTHIGYQVLIDNVEIVLLEERLSQLKAPRTSLGRISFNKFNRHDEINAYMDELAKSHSQLVNVVSIGKSHEGRDMRVIQISTDRSAGKPIIFVDAGIHAREWAAPAQATYIINQIVENPDVASMLDKVDWHILPVVNPDGYEFSHTNQRLWRKTRSPGKLCYGADANRNFDFHWGVVGASKLECDITYMGSEAFSEVEARNIKDYVLENKEHIKLYLTLHSYGNYFLYPWGYTSAVPENADELQFLGDAAAAAIKDYSGTRYTVGSSTNVLYPAAGGSDDWVKGVGGVPLAYTVELPGGGSQGFNPPPSQILPIVTETWVGIKVFHEYVAGKWGLGTA